MSGFANVRATDPKSKHEATAGFVPGAIMLAMSVILVVAQVVFATLDPTTLAAAVQQAPFGIVAPLLQTAFIAEPNPASQVHGHRDFAPAAPHR
jgi:hypothetical protein